MPPSILSVGTLNLGGFAMNWKRVRHCVIAVSLVTACASTAYAQFGVPVITRADADTTAQMLLVQGSNFVSNPLPRVLLGTDQGGFQELTVTSATDRGVNALLPAVTPGSYRIVIQFGRLGVLIATFDVAIGAVGPQGPEGPPGPPGQQGTPGTDHSGAIAALQEQVDDLTSRIQKLESLLGNFSRTGNDIIISGANLHLRNGEGTTASANGLGNLVVGYNELRGADDDRTGSHNVVVGSRHNYSSYGGLVAGLQNAIAGAFASVAGGQGNHAGGAQAAIGGGENITLNTPLAWASRNFFADATDTRVSGFTILVKADAAASLEAGTNANVKASANVNVNAGVTTDLKGSFINATATGPMVLKGSIIQLN
jgi:hypothetical protein